MVSSYLKTDSNHIRATLKQIQSFVSHLSCEYPVTLAVAALYCMVM